MKDTDQILMSAGESIEYARQYIHQQGELLKLEAAERLSKTTSSLITAIALALVATITAIMLSIAAGFWLGQIWDSYAKAFLAISGIYAIVGVVFFFFKKKIIMNPVLDFTLNAFFEDEDDN